MLRHVSSDWSRNFTACGVYTQNHSPADNPGDITCLNCLRIRKYKHRYKRARQQRLYITQGEDRRFIADNIGRSFCFEAEIKRMDNKEGTGRLCVKHVYCVNTNDYVSEHNWLSGLSDGLIRAARDRLRSAAPAIIRFEAECRRYDVRRFGLRYYNGYVDMDYGRCIRYFEAVDDLLQQKEHVLTKA